MDIGFPDSFIIACYVQVSKEFCATNPELEEIHVYNEYKYYKPVSVNCSVFILHLASSLAL